MPSRILSRALGILAIIVVVPQGAFASLEQAPASWLGTIEQGIRSSEYHFSPQIDGSSSAPNRAHNLRSFVSLSGWRLSPRAPVGESWELSLRLARVGRGTSLSDPGFERLAVEGDKIELVGGLLTEWLHNTPRGVEQGFAIPAVVGDRSAGDPLRLEMEVGGTVRAQVEDEGRVIEFATASGRSVLRYAELVVRDATARQLSSWFEAEAGRLSIVIDDRGADYPLLVDPLATATDWFAEVNQISAEFGLSVASAGDVNCDGYADVIVSADEYDNPELSEGAAFLYYGSATGPSTTPSWTAESNQPDADFGLPVVSGGRLNNDNCDDVIIGAHKYDNGQIDEGAIFVYFGAPMPTGLGPPGTPANADWVAESNQDGARFGIAVSAGDFNGDGFNDIIVGADEWDNLQEGEGAAFVFNGSATGPDLLGTRLSGNPLNADWRVETNRVDTDFGHSVDSAGDVDGDGKDDAIVGAWNFQESFEEEGRAYVYLGSSSGLSTTPHRIYEGSQSQARFGWEVAGAGDVNDDNFDDIIVGARNFANGEFHEGAAFIFFGSGGGLAQTPGWLGESNQANADYGYSVAGLGDVNGDGFADVGVGADLYDDGQLNEGAFFVYLGSPTGPSRIPAHVADSDQPGARLGVSIATAGDVNDDGFDDVIVGANLYDKPEQDEGLASLYFGFLDLDADGINDAFDNCPGVANPSQANADGDSQGDQCDACTDADGDTVCDGEVVLVQSSGAGEEVLVEFGSTMRYLANNPPSGPGGIVDGSWMDPLFPDGSWSTGQYGVGYDQVGQANNLFQTPQVPLHTYSVYTRATFTIADLDAVDNLFLGADYDDGYVVWINGSEVFRSLEMPAGPPVWNTDTVVDHESSNGVVPNYGILQDISVLGIPPLLEAPSVNVLAVGIYNRGAAGSSDLVLVPRLSINRPTSSTMSYKANSVDPVLGPEWTERTYNDGSWQRGSYGVGFETASGADNLIHTDVPSGSFSIYTRAKFSVSTAAVNDLRLGVDYDDGYVAWINGIPVHKSPEMSTFTPAWNTPTTAAHESSNGPVPDYGTFVDITAAAETALVDGENVLAIGVWSNNAPADDDLVLVPKLSLNGAVVDNCPTVFNPNQADMDGDGIGNVCDDDRDGDGVLNVSDNCPDIPNTDQLNSDGDSLGNVCDSCPNDAQNDIDADGLCADFDNCDVHFNPNQEDNDSDGMGDPCDDDDDNDTILDVNDNCPFIANTGQENVDGDPNGTVCDCDDGLAAAWATPSAITTLRLFHNDGSGITDVTWLPPSYLGATSVLYDTLRSSVRNDFNAAASCLDDNASDTATSDGSGNPGPGGVYYYLARVENICPTGNSNMGYGIGGAPRTGRNCP